MIDGHWRNVKFVRYEWKHDSCALQIIAPQWILVRKWKSTCYSVASSFSLGRVLLCPTILRDELRWLNTATVMGFIISFTSSTLYALRIASIALGRGHAFAAVGRNAWSAETTLLSPRHTLDKIVL